MTLQKLKSEISKLNFEIGKLADKANMHFDEQSERWQESDAGNEYREVIDLIEAAVGELDGIEP